MGGKEELKKYLTEQLEIVAVETSFMVGIKEPSVVDMMSLAANQGKLIFGQQILKFLEENEH